MSRKQRRDRKQREVRGRRREGAREAAQAAHEAEDRELARELLATARRTLCPVCGAELDDHRCSRCGAAFLRPVDETTPLSELRAAAADVRVRVRGRVAASPGRSCNSDDWRQGLALELGGAVVLHLACDGETRWLGATGDGDDRDEAPATGTEVEAVGPASDVFGEQVGGPREAARPEHRLQAAFVAVGPHASEVLERELERDGELAPRQRLVELPRAHEPPYGVDLEWDEPLPARRRLHIFHKLPEAGEWVKWLRGPGVGALIVLVLGLLTLVGGSCNEALALFNAGAPWVLVPGPFLLIAAMFIGAGGRRISVDSRELDWGYWPLPWAPGGRVAAADVARVLREEQALVVELRSGERRRLLAKGTVEQLDYVQAIVTKALLDGPGDWIDERNLAAEPYSGRLGVMMILGFALLPAVAALLATQCNLTS